MYGSRIAINMVEAEKTVRNASWTRQAYGKRKKNWFLGSIASATG